MPYELGRALLLSEAVTPAALARALYVVATEGIPLPRVLVALGFITPERLDDELARTDAPVVHTLVPVPSLLDALPSGLCSRLLALPIRMDPRTGTVDVAVADTRDPHGANEIGFFLKAPVRMVRAPLAMLERALDRSTAPPAMHALAAPPHPNAHADAPRSIWAVQRRIKETPAWGTPVPRPAPMLANPVSPFGVNAEPIESDLPPVLRVIPQSPGPAERRSRPSYPMAHALLANDTMATSGRRASFLPTQTARPDSWIPDEPTLPFPDPSRIIATMRSALDRDEVLHALLMGTRAVARKVALFVVKRDAFVGWRCTPEFGDESELRKIRIASNLPSTLATAAAAGRYLGPLYRTEAHAPLLQVMGNTTRDIAMSVVRLRGQATMLVVADELGDTALGTQRIDELARIAGEALTRILKRAR
ncbi:hypothetical protein [Pendulispora albinea]|uniref:Type II secretion system protein GspE N-terminal domain-containing protein n=1 Tax=Pendulispora albinea TaxID=2741071 RepID=A0ABZ2LUE5_9BACT